MSFKVSTVPEKNCVYGVYIIFGMLSIELESTGGSWRGRQDFKSSKAWQARRLKACKRRVHFAS